MFSTQLISAVGTFVCLEFVMDETAQHLHTCSSLSIWYIT